MKSTPVERWGREQVERGTIPAMTPADNHLGGPHREELWSEDDPSESCESAAAEITGSVPRDWAWSPWEGKG